MIGDLTIREITPIDAPDVAALSDQLGYPVSVDQIRARISDLAILPEHTLYAACLGDQLVGWIDVSIVQHLQSGKQGEIGGLVVAEGYRSHGVGQMLVQKAEEWIRNQGVNTMLVRSRTTRERAHRFYLRQDFSHTKTSFVFTKTLD